MSFNISIKHIWIKATASRKHPPNPVSKTKANAHDNHRASSDSLLTIKVLVDHLNGLLKI